MAGSVHDWRSDGALRESDALAIFSRLGNALQYLHAHDVVHCDIKLENLLLGCARDPTSVKLADFGLAKVICKSGGGGGGGGSEAKNGDECGEGGSGGGGPRRTRRQSENIVGTLGFMAPEVVFGLNFTLRGTLASGGARSTLKTTRASFGPEVDVWSAEVALYVMLGGSADKRYGRKLHRRRCSACLRARRGVASNARR